MISYIVARKKTGELKNPYIEAKYSTLNAIVNAVTVSSASITMAELKRILEDKDIQSSLRKGIMPYIYAAGFLSFSGREISASNISKIVASIGIKPDLNYINMLEKLNLKSHLIYLYAFYFVLANGRMASKDDLVRVVEAVGAEPDPKRAEEIIKFVESH